MNPNTLTPETDAQIRGPIRLYPHSLCETEVVVADFARKLERERDEARKTCAELVTDGNAVTLAESLHKIEAERDQLRKVCDSQQQAMTKFIAKVESGKARSVETYKDFCECRITYNQLPHLKNQKTK
jgi:hypothetical protein